MFAIKSFWELAFSDSELTAEDTNTRWSFEKFVDWRQCAAVMQREA
jgi:hypothetical protein